MRRMIPLVLLGFGVALAIVIGQRMSTDAMAVVIGVAVGVAASVPTSLLLIALLRKERQSFRETEPPAGWTPYPPMLPPAGAQPFGSQPSVIVIDPNQFAQYRQQAGYPLPPQRDGQLPDGGARSLRVVGSDDDWN